MEFSQGEPPLSSEVAGRAGITDSNHDDRLFADTYPLRILVAEDNYISRRTLVLMLERFGYKVTSVENGLDCLHAATMGSFDLILADIDMPVMNGIDCARCIRQEKIDVPIIAVTAEPPEFSRLECFAAGMNSYIKKPVEMEELKNNLRTVFLGRNSKNKLVSGPGQTLTSG